MWLSAILSIDKVALQLWESAEFSLSAAESNILTVMYTLQKETEVSFTERQKEQAILLFVHGEIADRDTQLQQTCNDKFRHEQYFVLPCFGILYQRAGWTAKIRA